MKRKLKGARCLPGRAGQSPCKVETGRTGPAGTRERSTCFTLQKGKVVRIGVSHRFGWDWTLPTN